MVWAVDSGTITDDGDGTWAFAPGADFNGSVTLSYNVSDGTNSVADAGTITVTAVNDAPNVDMTSPVSLSLAEDGTLLITQADFLSNATDVDGDTLSVSGVTVDSGTVTDNGDGTWAFAPGADFNGSVTLSYNVSDGTNSVADAGTITVTAVNDAPDTLTDSAGTNEDSAVTILTSALLNNDSDVEGDTLTLTGVFNALGGSVNLDGNGDVVFTPTADFNGSASFDYTVSDGNGGTATQTVTVDVTAVNDAPNTAGNSASISEDTAVTVLASTLLANDSDIDGDTLSISGVSNAVNGAVALDGNGDVVFTPAADFNGAATFDYTVSDGNGGTATQTVSVDVTAVNDAPSVDMTSPVSLSLAEDGNLLITQAEFLSNASDIEGDTLSVSGVTVDSGTITDNGDGTWAFAPGADFNGSVTLSYNVSDGTNSVADAGTITVTAVNDAPVVSAPATGSLAEDSALVVTTAELLANATDVDGDTLSVSNLAVTGTDASVTDNGDGTWTISPVGEFNGAVRLSYDVSDGTSTVAGSLDLTIAAVNDAPAAISDSASTSEDTAVTVLASTLLANDSDIDGDTLSISGVSNAVNGAVALNGDGNVVFTPAADFNGAATFDYTVSDGNGGTATQTVSVDVTAVNDAPVVNSMAAVLAEGTSVTVTASDLLASAMDVEGDSLSVSNVQVLGADASVTSDGNGAWTVTPVSGFTGSVSVTYDVNDGTAATSGNLDVTVMMSGGSAGGGSEFQVNTFTQYSQARPSVTALSDGGFLVVWDTYDPDGGDYEVFGQRYDASGAPAGSEFQVNSYTQSDQRFASVAALPDDGFVVTWESYGQDGSSTGILGQRYDISGAPTGSEFQVNSYTTANQVNPSVTAMSDGGFVMTWASWFQDGDGYGIFGQRYDVSGTPLGSDFQVNTYTQSSQVKSSVAAMSDGGFVVTWESYGQDGDTHGIFGQRYDTSGAPVGSEFQINSYTASSQTSSSVAGLSNGGFVVAWESYDQDGDGYEILGQRYDTSGASVGSEFQVNSFTQDDQRYPSVAAMPDGGFLVTWGSNNQDGGDWGIFGQRYGASGSPLGSEFQINSHTGNAQNHSSVAALPDGGFVVTWQSEGSQDGSESGIFAKIFEASSELAGTDGNDILVGGNEDDILTGGDGNDRLEGGAGDDLFIFTNGGNDDTITDFTVGADTDDVIDLTEASAISNLDGVQGIARQVGQNTFIDFGGGDSITLLGVDLNNLHQDDFIF